MSPVLALVLSAGVSYFLGSIPFSLMIARRFCGVDLRQHGSGNVGATNVARTMGAKWGIFALLCDATKGSASVILIPWMLNVDESMMIHQKVICAVFAVIGHMFSIWLGLRGGKGVATALGAVAVLSPLATLWAFVGFALTFLLKRIVSLSSIVAAIVFAISQIGIYRASLWTSQQWSLGVFSIALPALIIFQHRSNIVRLLRGEEAQLQLGRSKQKLAETADDIDFMNQ